MCRLQQLSRPSKALTQTVQTRGARRAHTPGHDRRRGVLRLASGTISDGWPQSHQALNWKALRDRRSKWSGASGKSRMNGSPENWHHVSWWWKKEGRSWGGTPKERSEAGAGQHIHRKRRPSAVAVDGLGNESRLPRSSKRQYQQSPSHLRLCACLPLPPHAHTQERRRTLRNSRTNLRKYN